MIYIYLTTKKISVKEREEMPEGIKGYQLEVLEESPINMVRVMDKVRMLIGKLWELEEE